ncbi:MAG TPA: hypothetical protein PLS71_11785, partial [Leptospiraceae bacterium]|nr:hypothetical protein [Leptospiraceae bacterium]
MQGRIKADAYANIQLQQRPATEMLSFPFSHPSSSSLTSNYNNDLQLKSQLRGFKGERNGLTSNYNNDLQLKFTCAAVLVATDELTSNYNN